MIIHNSPLDDHHTLLYNLMCEIERDVYDTCDELSRTITEYTGKYGVPNEWHIMSTNEWYQHYETIEHDDSEKARAARAYFRILFTWDFSDHIEEKYTYRAEQLFHKQKRAWEWLDTITNRSVESYRHANRELLSAKA